jgi:dipeptidyl aminopeptidase/acylaminoacyl peptidase
MLHVARCALLAALIASLASAQKEPFTAEVMMQIKRISGHQLSPDGLHVAFTVQTIDIENNTRPRQIYLVSLIGGRPRQVTTEGSANHRPRWSPDSEHIAFISNRSGSSQVWLMNADGSSQRRVTDLSTEADGVMFSGDGRNLVFTSEVYPECGADDVCNKRRLEEEKNSKVQARMYTSLLYRHWNEWKGKRRKHILVVPVEGAGDVRDLTPGTRDVPPFSLGGMDDYAVSPDGLELCYVMSADAEPAISTNSDLYVVPFSGGEARRITLNAAADNSPLYSPDGNYIAYRAQARAGFESDRWRLMLLDRATGITRTLTENLDRPVQTIAWAPDSKRVFFTTEDRGRAAIQWIPIQGGASRTVVSGSSHLDDPQFTPDGRTMVYSEMSGAKPVELYLAASGEGSPRAVTRLNEDVLNRYQLTALEEFWVEGAEGVKVHSFLVKPPGFVEGRKYPVLFLIHGGPQGAWGETWSYRWNPQVFAAAGFVVVMPNPRGSTGYGQKFTDEISGDWGGKVFEDLMSVAMHVERQPWADKDRFAAAGGSYGGYMVNWLLGHSDRFQAFVSHAGVFDLRSMAGETEELWFTIWEFGGLPWQTPEIHERWSPSNYVREFKTPTLVIHGELDYRVPYGQGLQLFTALQMQKVPSKLLLYPDEGHWILKPQNSLLWYREFLEWVTEWTQPVERSAPAGDR